MSTSVGMAVDDAGDVTYIFTTEKEMIKYFCSDWDDYEDFKDSFKLSEDAPGNLV